LKAPPFRPQTSSSLARAAAPRDLARIVAACVLAGAVFASSALGAESPPHANRDALRQIVQDQCLVHWSHDHDPAPCERVDSGSAVLADRKGGAHYLLIPTKTMAGVESGELLDPDTPNYFAAAWRARDRVAAFVGHGVPRSAIAMAVNNAHSRTQDQFHIHIECLRRDVLEALRTAAEHLTETWSPLAAAGSTYLAVRIMGEDLDAANPFELLANQVPDARHRMGDYTLVVAGMDFKAGPGFVVLAGTGPTGELLLDATCAVAG
jgi:CDP-diacylglycerol pyrophosphatase